MGTTAAQRKLFFNLRKEAEKLLSEYDHVDTKLLAANLDVKEKEVIEMQKRLSGGDVSLDAPLSSDDEGGASRGSLLAADVELVDELLAAEEIRQHFADHVREFRKTLKGRDLEIFEQRMIAEEPLTLQEVGDRYQITRERARQIEARILQKLKDFVAGKGIIDIDAR
jgi:RNA polymerase sigma-32 factor